MTKFADHAAYITAAPEGFQPLLTELRGWLAAALRGLEELIAQDLPGFGKGKNTVADNAAFT